MHCRHGVKKLRIHVLQARLKKLGTDNHRHRAADEKHDKGKHQVHGADVLVVG